MYLPTIWRCLDIRWAHLRHDEEVVP